MITKHEIIAISFIGLVLLVGRPLFKKLRAFLYNKQETIRRDLENAERVYQKAENNLALYKTKNAALEEEKQRILANVQQEIEAIKKLAMQELQQELNSKLEAALKRINEHTNLAIQSLREHVIDIAVGAVKRNLYESGDTKFQEELLKYINERLNKTLH